MLFGLVEPNPEHGIRFGTSTVLAPWDRFDYGTAHFVGPLLDVEFRIG